MESTYFAHHVESADGSGWQTLRDHLGAVADRAAEFSAEFGFARWGRCAGLLHDVGKATPAFQERLRGSQKLVDHSTAGAQMAVERFGIPGKLMAYALAGHHGGMPNGVGSGERRSLDVRLADYERDSGIDGFLESAGLRIPCERDLEGFRFDLSNNRFGADAWARNRCIIFSMFVLTGMLHSALVDADYLDTEAFMQPELAQRRNAARKTTEELEVLLTEHIRVLREGAAATPVNAARNAILEDCLAAAEGAPGIYRLAVPTGSGKTLSAMAFALRHINANRAGMKRVIYAAPYTSIIEQTADVYASVFGWDSVVEHHSDYEPRTSDEEQEIRNRLATQNWDAPVVVTTNVQLLESLFSNKPGRRRKVHNIANSVIILDEAQVLPDGLLVPTLAMFEELTIRYNVTVVLCTATQPALDGLWPFKSAVSDISVHRDSFGLAFGGRTKFEHIGAVELFDIAERIARHDQVLCIVGNKQAVRDLFEELVSRARASGELADGDDPGEQGFFHLSTWMTPAHRGRVIECIKSRLADGRRCVVVSTQLVEAGVDFDFPVVYREMAGMDSLCQAAGRCNREGRRETCPVYVFDARHEGKAVSSGDWLEKTKGITRILVAGRRGVFGEELVEPFFRSRYHESAMLDNLDSKGIFRRLTDQSLFSSEFKTVPFEDCARDYRLIENEDVSVFVVWDEESGGLYDELATMMTPGSMARKLQRHTIGIPSYRLQPFREEGVVEEVGPITVIRACDGCRSFYDSSKGLLWPGKETLMNLMV